MQLSPTLLQLAKDLPFREGPFKLVQQDWLVEAMKNIPVQHTVVMGRSTGKSMSVCLIGDGHGGHDRHVTMSRALGAGYGLGSSHLVMAVDPADPYVAMAVEVFGANRGGDSFIH